MAQTTTTRKVGPPTTIDSLLGENALGQLTGQTQTNITQAFIGYFSVNLYDLPDGFKFGVFNDRQAKSARISDLNQNFRTEGLLHCDRQTAIPIGLRRDWISSNPTVQPKEGDIKSVEELTFTDNGQRALAASDVIVFGGNHRRLALKKYIDTLIKRREEVEKQINKLQAEEDRDESQKAKAAQWRADFEQLATYVDVCKLWLVVVYDLATFETMEEDGLECMKYLSRNEAKAIYVESNEERLVMKIRELVEAEDKDIAKSKATQAAGFQAAKDRTNWTNALDRVRAWATNTHSSYSRVFSSEEAAVALPWLMRLGTHIRHAAWLKVGWVGDTFSSQHGGVMGQVIVNMKPAIEGCVADGDFIDMKEVDDKIAQCFHSDNPDLEERNRIESMLIAESGPMPRWHGGLLDTIDEVFRLRFLVAGGKKAVAGFLDVEDEAYLELMEEYKDEVVEACLVESGRRLNMNMDGAKTFPSRVKWLLSTTHIPLPTASFIPALDILFKQIPLVFDELLRWFDPIVYYTGITAVRSNKVRDTSSLLLLAIESDRTFTADDGKRARNAMSNLILKSASSLLLEMESDLRRVKDKSNLVSSIQELDALFPSEIRMGGQNNQDNNFELHQVFVNNKTTKQSLIDEYNMLSERVRKVPSFTTNERFAKYPSDRFLDMTTHKIGPDFKSFKRDFNRIILAIMLETRLMESYRPALLQGAAGILRQKLMDAFTPLARKISVLVGGPGSVKHVRRWEFPDIIEVQPLKTPQKKSAHEVQTAFDANINETADRKAIQALITRVEKMAIAQLQSKTSTGKSKAKAMARVAVEVSNPLKELAKGLDLNSSRRRARQNDEIGNADAVSPFYLDEYHPFKYTFAECGKDEYTSKSAPRKRKGKKTAAAEVQEVEVEVEVIGASELPSSMQVEPGTQPDTIPSEDEPQVVDESGINFDDFYPPVAGSSKPRKDPVNDDVLMDSGNELTPDEDEDEHAPVKTKRTAPPSRTQGRRSPVKASSTKRVLSSPDSGKAVSKPKKRNIPAHIAQRDDDV